MNSKTLNLLKIDSALWFFETQIKLEKSDYFSVNAHQYMNIRYYCLKLFKILKDDRIYRFLDLFSTKVPFQDRISKTEFLTFLETIKVLRKEYANNQ